MTNLITGYHYDIGRREIYEDRVNVQEITTSGNIQLAIAVVADGVGGENKGERASQLAIDSLFQYLKSSTEMDISVLLSKAAMVANQQVHHIARETGGASTTLAIAAVDKNDKLYVANVGDSRVYLCRNQKLTQLTMDHTFANIMPLRGKMSVEAARENPRAEVLMRAVGPREKIPIDIGFYVNTNDPKVANSRGREGLPLKKGDSILVCSDGLIKESPSGVQYATDEEIIQVVNTQEGEKAARNLVSFALGRDADDNVSAALIQMPDPARHRAAKRPFYMMAGAGLLLFLIAAVIVGFVFRNQQGEQDTLASESTAAAIAASTRDDQANLLASSVTETAVAAVTQTAVVAAYTPTPTPTPTLTPTPRPTSIPGQIGYYISDIEQRPFTLADPIESGSENIQLHINNDISIIPEDAYIFAQPTSKIEFENVTTDSAAEAGISILLYEGSNIFLDTGGYLNGADISPIADERISFFISGSCMSAEYDTETSVMLIGCYEGNCSYRADKRDEATTIEEAYLLKYDVLGRNVIETRRILRSESVVYKNILLQSDAGRTVHDRCILPIFPPIPPTNTPTPTDAPATVTDVPTSKPKSATDTPIPPPTATDTPIPPPTATDTPIPPPTATDTPIPPPTATDTPMPPPTATDTPMPPPTATDTPKPGNGPPSPTPCDDCYNQIPSNKNIPTTSSKSHLPLLAFPTLFLCLGAVFASSYSAPKKPEQSDKK